MSVPKILIPEDEAIRLQTLRRYDVIHSLYETVFDEFVALTARIFNLPISLIALVDEKQVYYPANYGMPGNKVQAREESLCSTAVVRNRAVVYKDLLIEQDPFITVQAAQAAQNNRIRFYAGAPLRMPDERSIGTLCIVDYNPRIFSPVEQQVLEELAALISETIVTRYRCKNQLRAGERRWQHICEQVQEEVQGLTALVRYLLTRYGTQVPVSEVILSQVGRRFQDVHEILAVA